jgi:hypothetical protein
MFVFFSEVMLFGKFISGMRCFKEGSILSIAMTFSGTLFLSIALLDIIPEAIHNFDIYFEKDRNHAPAGSNLHTNSNLPLTMIIASFTFLVIMYIDKILIGHSHDHEYEVSFTSNPKLSAHHHDSKHKNNEEQHQEGEVVSN